MDLPAVVPWWLCWVGVLVGFSFAILSLFHLHSRNPSVWHEIFFWLSILGFVVMLLPVVVNFAVLAWRIFIDAMTQMHTALTPRTY